MKKIIILVSIILAIPILIYASCGDNYFSNLADKLKEKNSIPNYSNDSDLYNAKTLMEIKTLEVISCVHDHNPDKTLTTEDKYSKEEEKIIDKHKINIWLKDNPSVYEDYRPIFISQPIERFGEKKDFMLIPLPGSNNEWTFSSWEYTKKFINNYKNKYYVSFEKDPIMFFHWEYIYIYLGK